MSKSATPPTNKAKAMTRARPPQCDVGLSSGRSKMVPFGVGIRTYRDHQRFYDKVQRDLAKAAGTGLRPGS